MTLYYFMDWRNDYFTVTDQRIIHEERSFLTGREQREQLLLSSVQNMNIIREGYLAELIGFANLVITTSGGSQPLVLDRMANPLLAQKVIFDQLQRRGSQVRRIPICSPATDRINTLGCRKCAYRTVHA